MNLFLTAQTAPFGVALALMIGLALLEAVGAMSSASPGSVLDNLIPEVDGDGILDWLHVGQTPVMVLLILFLAGFGLSGYIAQAISGGVFGRYLPLWIAAPGALAVGIGAVRVMGGLIGRWVPRDETASISEAELVGRSGVILRGDARHDYAAEARVYDAGGAVHYLMVEADEADDVLEQGTEIVIVGKVGSRFRAIRFPHARVM